MDEDNLMAGIWSILFHIEGILDQTCFCPCKYQFQLLYGILSYIYDSHNLRFVHRISYKNKVLLHDMVEDSPHVFQDIPLE